MFDLSVLKEKSFELKLFNGEVIHIKRPSQKMVIDMMGYEDDFKSEKDSKKKIASLTAMVIDILNNNIEQQKFNKAYVESNFDFNLALLLIQNYMEFVAELNSNPN